VAIHPDILGKGWAFPFRFSSIGRVKKLIGVAAAEKTDKVAMAIKQILGTKIGSRVIDRDFGSDLRGLIFTPIDELSAARIRYAILDSIQKWERRVEVLNIDISITRALDGVIDADIQFRIIATQQIGNLVYPLYITSEMRVQGQINVGGP
jgi:hypothetical protein